MNETTSSAREKMTLSTARVPLSKLIYLAQQEGLFNREGLDVTLVTTTHGKDALDLMLTGKADLAASSSMPITYAILEGARPALLASLCKSDSDLALVMRGIDSAADLRGKRVGVSFHTSSHFYLHNLLVDAGIPRRSVNIVNVEPAAAIKGLAAGRLDASVLHFPWQIQAANVLGPKVSVESAPIYTSHWILAADRDFLKQRPQAAQKVLRALLAAERISAEQPERMSQVVDGLQDMTPTRQAAYLKRYKDEVHLTQSMIITMESEARWHNALLTKEKHAIPNFLDYVDSASLRSVRPEAVKITE